MGKIIQRGVVRNAGEVFAAENGLIDVGAIRSVEVDFLVDTGAAMLCLPASIIKELRLVKRKDIEVQTANGIVKRSVYSSVDLKVLDRDTEIAVMELLDDGTPPLLGYLPLEALDLYPNPKAQILQGNPATNGKWIVDLLLNANV
jgi:predicted aspartyl protease